MVAQCHLVIHLAAVRFPVAAAHNVVDAHVEAALVVAYAGTVAGSCVAVGKVLADGVMGVRDGTVVEIAHADDALVAVAGYEACHGLGLGRTYRR